MKFHETRIKVRFNEIDAYQVAWHGHYVSWMETGRIELAAKFDLDPFSLSEEGFLNPVISLELKYLKPAGYNDELTIKTGIRRTETATLQFISEIADCSGQKVATGVTTHALTDLDGILQFQLPQRIIERIDKMMESLEVS